MPATSSTIPINGYALRAIRKGLRISPAQLAEAIRRDRTYIVKIETGSVDRVGVETFDALVMHLGLEDRRAIMALPHGAVVAA
jgi:transcriptional regulator with XRE-family HTH domain